MDISLFSSLVAGLFLVGLLMLPLVWFARTPTARRRLFWLALGFINIGGLWVLMVLFLITRLEGSRPPTLLEVFARGLWAPALILLLANLTAVGIMRVRGR